MQEVSTSYQEIPDEDNIILEGYWQSERYWHGLNKEISEVLEFEYRPADYVSVHVRRGDYLQFPDQFPVLPIDYYTRAMQYCANNGYSHFKIYSDDIKWCQRAFNTDLFNDVQITYSTGKSAIDDMRDMFNGAGLIIANSSFSLFPALLRTDNPLIIAPKEDRWFGPKNKHLDSMDRLPERFIKM